MDAILFWENKQIQTSKNITITAQTPFTTIEVAGCHREEVGWRDSSDHLCSVDHVHRTRLLAVACQAPLMDVEGIQESICCEMNAILCDAKSLPHSTLAMKFCLLGRWAENDCVATILAQHSTGFLLRTYHPSRIADIPFARVIGRWTIAGRLYHRK